jgi:hypothetical protein
MIRFPTLRISGCVGLLQARTRLYLSAWVILNECNLSGHEDLALLFSDFLFLLGLGDRAVPATILDNVLKSTELERH